MEQGDSRGVVAAVRALAAAGWTVGVGAPRGGGLAAASRRCAQRHVVPAAYEDLDGFLTGIAGAVATDGYEVVFGAGEAEVHALSANREHVAARVPYANDAVVRRALDKTSLEEAAGAAGLTLPAAVAPADLGPATPVVVKARRHAAPERPGAPPRIDTNVVFGAEAARRRVAQIQADGADPIVQEYLTGQLLAYVAVTDRDGAVVVDSMQVASRIWPPHAGASCRARTIPVAEELAAACRRLFAALGWFGLAEVQFVAPAGTDPRLIDFNGRFYGSMSLAVAAGANLPAAWAALATGRSVAPARARPGVRYQWLEGDVRRALVERNGGLVHDLGTTMVAAAGSRHSLWEVRDPGPAAARLKRLLR